MGDERLLVPNQIALTSDGMDATVSAGLNRHVVGDAYFVTGFCWDWFGFCRCADGVGDDPTGACQRDADRVARPIEVIAWPSGEIWNPDQ
jgi:hypothetical protein